MLRVMEKILGIVLLYYLAAVHENDPVSYGSCESHLVGDAYHRDSLVCKLYHHIKHFFYHFRVKRGCGFVKQHDPGLHAEAPCDSDALLLST